MTRHIFALSLLLVFVGTASAAHTIFISDVGLNEGGIAANADITAAPGDTGTLHIWVQPDPTIYDPNHSDHTLFAVFLDVVAQNGSGRFNITSSDAFEADVLEDQWVYTGEPDGWVQPSSDDKVADRFDTYNQGSVAGDGQSIDKIGGVTTEPGISLHPNYFQQEDFPENPDQYDLHKFIADTGYDRDMQAFLLGSFTYAIPAGATDGTVEIFLTNDESGTADVHDENTGIGDPSTAGTFLEMGLEQGEIIDGNDTILTATPEAVITVPEPLTLTLLTTAGAAGLLRRRRRRA